MSKILSKKQLSANVFRMDVEAPLIAKERKAGQFIILQVDSTFGERIPLTIADADPVAGTVTIIFQTVGASTMKLSQFNVGDDIPAFVGPLGRPTDVRKVGHVVCVGGGVGVAPMHPIAQAFKAAGNKVTVIIGARTKELVIMEDEMRKASDELIIVTDDGSYGRKGLVTEPLKELCEKGGVDEVVIIGPPIMMKFAALTTKPFGIHTLASLNTIMIDGTGMCGGCRITVGGQTKFVCVDGPEFDAHQVDFDQMLKRARSFSAEEKSAREHVCSAGIFGKGSVSQHPVPAAK